MAQRLFDLPETKGTFQIRGQVTGTQSQRFYTEKQTRNGKEFRAVNFGIEYDKNKTVYMRLNGMQRDKVYFTKRNNDGTRETKAIDWKNRLKFNDNSFNMIGTHLGIEKTINEEGQPVNLRKVMTEYDACAEIRDKLQDGVSVFVKGNIEYGSYSDNNGNIRRSVNQTPTQISLGKIVDFDAFDDENKPESYFRQVIVFTGIDKEKDDNNKCTGRYVMSAKIITYNDIVDTQFIVDDERRAIWFKKNLKPYNSIQVSGNISVRHQVEDVEDDDDPFEPDRMQVVRRASVVEYIIVGRNKDSLDTETYNEENISNAIHKIRNSQNAERNFNASTKKSTNDVPWEDDFMDDDDEVWG